MSKTRTVAGPVRDFIRCLASSWGRLEEAYGERYRAFDLEPRHTCRLPGPPYLFQHRVTRLELDPENPLRDGATLEAECDVDPDDWYFSKTGPTMPFACLLETALQPCGWLGVEVGTPFLSNREFFFRNLDGHFKSYRSVTPEMGTLTTRATLTKTTQAGGIILQNFDVHVSSREGPVCEIQTVFGWFLAETLAHQVGLPTTEEERAGLVANDPMETIELRGRAEMGLEKLRMLDRVTGFWPQGGKAGLGRLRAEKDVNPDEWFFKSHFYGDPVMPGSLGLESMLQLLRFFLVHTGKIPDPESVRFRPAGSNSPFVYKYRGQVVPSNRRVDVIADIREITDDRVSADCTLWVDGRKIYQAGGVSLGWMPGRKRRPLSGLLAAGPMEIQERQSLSAKRRFDPASEAWLNDHCPTFVIPALPFTFMATTMAEASERLCPGLTVVAMEEAKVSRWLAFPRGPEEILIEAKRLPDEGVTARVQVSLLSFREAARKELSRFEPFCTGTMRLAPDYPTPPNLPSAAETAMGPSWSLDGRTYYDDGYVFHGPSLQLIREIHYRPPRIHSLLQNPAGGSVPEGVCIASILDGLTQSLPNDRLHKVWPDIAPAQVAYPHAFRELNFFGPPPETAELRCEIELKGFRGSDRLPEFEVVIRRGPKAADPVWIHGRYVEVLLPLGPLFREEGKRRVDFVRRRLYVPGMGVARREGGTAKLTLEEVKRTDWLSGTLARLYLHDEERPLYESLPRDAALHWLTLRIAAKDAAGAIFKTHPSRIRIEETGTDLLTARSDFEPFHSLSLAVSQHNAETAVSIGKTRFSLESTRSFWRQRFGDSMQWIERMSDALSRRFIKRVSLEDPDAFRAVRGRPVFFLGNHQTYIESVLFNMVASPLLATLLVAVAKRQHKDRWVCQLTDALTLLPGLEQFHFLLLINRDNPQEILQSVSLLEEQIRREPRSVLIHVEGRRSTAARDPVKRVSSVWLDLALKLQMPIVPVRFLGGLPEEDLGKKYDFPVDYGAQGYFFGKPILPEEIASLPYARRSVAVCEAINRLGDADDERPGKPNDDFAVRVAAWSELTGVAPEWAAIFESLAETEMPPCEIRPGEQSVPDPLHALVLAGRLWRDLRQPTVLICPSTKVGEWLKDLANRLFGTDGPKAIAADQDRSGYPIRVIFA